MTIIVIIIIIRTYLYCNARKLQDFNMQPTVKPATKL